MVTGPVTVNFVNVLNEILDEKLRPNGIAHIRHQCRKTAVLSCHRFLVNSAVEKMNDILIWIRALTTSGN